MTSRFVIVRGITWAMFVVFCGTAAAQPSEVVATVETDPVPDGGDAADDPAIWIHPAHPSQSLIIGTDKLSGLAVYDLDGHEVQFLPDGMLNNVDVRYDFPVGGVLTDIVCAGNVRVEVDGLPVTAIY